ARQPPRGDTLLPPALPVRVAVRLGLALHLPLRRAVPPPALARPQAQLAPAREPRGAHAAGAAPRPLLARGSRPPGTRAAADREAHGLLAGRRRPRRDGCRLAPLLRAPAPHTPGASGGRAGDRGAA